MRLDGEQHKRAGRSPERRFRLRAPSRARPSRPPTKEDDVFDAFKTDGSSPPMNYRIREVRFSVVRARAGVARGGKPDE
jgi:hypothetical protein